MVESQYIMLPIIDRQWVDHLYVMDASRPASGCAATVRKIRASSTKKKPTRSSKILKNNIADEAIKGVFRVVIEQGPAPQHSDPAMPQFEPIPSGELIPQPSEAQGRLPPKK